MGRLFSRIRSLDAVPTVGLPLTLPVLSLRTHVQHRLPRGLLRESGDRKKPDSRSAPSHPSTPAGDQISAFPCDAGPLCPAARTNPFQRLFFVPLEAAPLARSPWR